MLSMLLRNFRWARWVMPWWVPAVGWAAGAALAILGTEWAEDCRIALGAAGLFTIVLLRRIARQMSAHQSCHRRRDRQHDSMVPVVRWTIEHDGGFAAGLEDEREQVPGVVLLRPRGAGPRHSRPRSRRPGA